MTRSNVRLVISILACCSVASACSNAPGGPTITDDPQSGARLVLDPPAVLHVGDAPVPIETHAYLADGRVTDLASAKCRPVWSSSASNIADVTDGIIRPNSVGDAQIHVECGSLQAATTVRVRRLITGMVKGRDSNLPIPGATVTVVGSDEQGSEVRTDASGSFVLSAGNEVDARASAAGFNTAEQHASVSQSDLQFFLEQQMLTVSWSGTFETEMFRKRIPAGSLDGFVFDTQNPGRITLTIEAGCITSGTYDDYAAILYSQTKPVLSIFAAQPSKRQTATRILLADSYTLRLSDQNVYASVGCPWHLELTRPN
jgi:hypothetical protein